MSQRQSRDISSIEATRLGSAFADASEVGAIADMALASEFES